MSLVELRKQLRELRKETMKPVSRMLKHEVHAELEKYGKKEDAEMKVLKKVAKQEDAEMKVLKKVAKQEDAEMKGLKKVAKPVAKPVKQEDTEVKEMKKLMSNKKKVPLKK